MRQVDFPNREVKDSFLEYLLPYYLKKEQAKSKNYILRMVNATKEDDPDEMLELMQAVYAGVTFESAKGIELHYRNIIFLVMYILGMNVEVEHHSSRGRLDFVLKTDKFIYVMEFKLDKSAGEALTQIEEKGYALQYAKDPRKLFLIGVNFSSQTNNIDEWIVK